MSLIASARAACADCDFKRRGGGAFDAFLKHQDETQHLWRITWGPGASKNLAAALREARQARAVVAA